MFLIVIFNISTIFPSALFAKDSNNASMSSNVSGARSLSRETRQKFLAEKQYLNSIGNPEEYKNIEVQWSTEKQKPSALRKLHKKASKNIAEDTKKAFRDFSSLYGISSQIADLRLEKDTMSKLTKERHTRLKQFHGNLEMVGGDIVSHSDKDGFLYQIDGAPDSVPTLSVTPTISEKDALLVAKKEHGTKANFQITKTPELVLYKFAAAYILSYRYTISYDDTKAQAGKWIYYVDAHTGKKINAYDLMNEASVRTTLSGSTLS